MNTSDLLKIIPPIDHEAIVARVEARRADFAERSRRDLFNPTNLGHWIELCVMAGVKHVPADEIARAARDDLLRFDEKETPPSVSGFFSTVELAMSQRGEGWMVRWSCCTCYEVKYRLGKGEPEWHPELVSSFHIGDVRAFDLVYEFPEETIAAYARPWVKAKIVDRYPVEYRVFVLDNQVAGISNYYPQRPLPNSADTLYDVVRCYLATVKLIQAQKKPLNCPPLEKHWDVAKNHWTADFIRKDDGEVWFLEGGPPHTQGGGAHPCCFSIGEIDGIAFAAAPNDLERMGSSARTKTKWSHVYTVQCPYCGAEPAWACRWTNKRGQRMTLAPPHKARQKLAAEQPAFPPTQTRT